MVHSIRVEVFRHLSVWADDAPILQTAAKINKPWQVFCYLLMHRGTPTPARQLIDEIWAREDLADPGNVLKNTIYALRREFPARGPTESPILFENGGYLCNPAIHFEVDADAFSAAYARAQKAEEDTKPALLREAAALYKGDFLPQLDGETWVTALGMLYRREYADTMHGLLGLLYKGGRYSELLAEAITANWQDPLEDTYALYMFRAMYALGMYRAILPAYHKAARTFAEELGAPLPAEIAQIYKSASEKLNQTEQDILLIRQDLEEAAGDGADQTGPLYCTYDVFKYLYQMVARAGRRNNQRIVILLLSLQSEGEAAPGAKSLSGAMAAVKDQIMAGLLRRTDTMARYSKSQYIIMLSTQQEQGAEVVMERLHKHLGGALAARGLKVVFRKTELTPKEDEGATL